MKLYLVFLFPIIVCCSDDHNINVPARNSGVQINMNGPRGSLYVDSVEKIYAFRSYEAVIKNDTLIAVEIQIGIPNKWHVLKPDQGQTYIGFLLPDSMTPDKQYDFALDNRHVSPQLNDLINTKLSLLTNRTVTLQPNESFFLKLGFLVYPAEGLFRANLFSQVNDSLKKSEIHNDLRLYVTMGAFWSETSIGRLTFLKK